MQICLYVKSRDYLGENKMGFIEKFKTYVKYETTSTEPKENCCSNAIMLDLAYYLLDEIQKFKPYEVSINKFGVIDAKFKGSKKKEPICLLAHIDTSNQVSGKNVKPIVEKYLGKDIKLKNNRVLSEKDFPYLSKSLNHTIVHSDGSTLLGSDDKSGIAIIMQALEEIKKEKKEHREIEIIFTTDEEIGVDAEHISREIVTSKYGYTIDGGDIDYASIETFSAYQVKVEVEGKSIHPGEAKNKMVNASNVFIAFHNMLPEKQRPENSWKKEPFYHLLGMQGKEESLTAHYIVRSFDEEEIKQMIERMKENAEKINSKLGYKSIKLNIKRQYKNMKSVLDKYPNIQKEIEEVYKSVGKKVKYEAVRGGTTGSRLSFMGLPCPNLGTGGYNFHGVYEYLDLDQALEMVKIVKKIIEV